MQDRLIPTYGRKGLSCNLQLVMLVSMSLLLIPALLPAVLLVTMPLLLVLLQLPTIMI